jgi:hypothetical protein
MTETPKSLSRSDSSLWNRPILTGTILSSIAEREPIAEEIHPATY